MGKLLSSESFKINDNLTVKCRSEKTSYGFRHLATLYDTTENEYSLVEIGRAKSTYYNRTWEKYEFDTVMQGLGRDEVSEFVKNRSSDSGTEMMKSVANIAKLGDVMCDSQEEKNTWKKRMLKAGLEKRGLNFPDDWDTLSEEEKERRLNGALKQMK